MKIFGNLEWFQENNKKAFVSSAGIGVFESLINAQTNTTYQLALEDVSKTITLTNADAITVTIPTNAVIPFPVGTRIDLIQGGAGKVTFSGAGVTIKSKANNKSISAQYAAVSLIKESTDSWYLIGDLIA